MTLWERLFNYFSADPLRLLTLFGGSGGVAYWFALIRNRARIRPKIIEEGLYNPSEATAGLEIEIVNLGKDPTSLEASIVMHGYTMKREPRQFVFEVSSVDRHLPPHTPKVIHAKRRNDAILPFLYFKTYRFVPTRGRTRNVFIRSASGAELGRLRFLVELVVFRLFGKVVAEHEGPV